jgi:hypothetical protein
MGLFWIARLARRLSIPLRLDELRKDIELHCKMARVALTFDLNQEGSYTSLLGVDESGRSGVGNHWYSFLAPVHQGHTAAAHIEEPHTEHERGEPSVH